MEKPFRLLCERLLKVIIAMGMLAVAAILVHSCSRALIFASTCISAMPQSCRQHLKVSSHRSNRCGDAPYIFKFSLEENSNHRISNKQRCLVGKSKQDAALSEAIDRVQGNHATMHRARRGMEWRRDEGGGRRHRHAAHPARGAPQDYDAPQRAQLEPEHSTLRSNIVSGKVRPLPGARARSASSSSRASKRASWAQASTWSFR